MARRRRQRRQDARRTAELVAAFATVNAYQREADRRSDRRDDRDLDWNLLAGSRRRDRRDERDEDERFDYDRRREVDYEPRFRWSRRRDRRDGRGPDLTERDILRAFDLTPADVGLDRWEREQRVRQMVTDWDARDNRDERSDDRAATRRDLEQLKRAVRTNIQSLLRSPLAVRYNTDPQLPTLPELDPSGRVRTTAAYSDDDTAVNAAVNLTINVMAMPGTPEPTVAYDPGPTEADPAVLTQHVHTYTVSADTGHDTGGLYEELTRRCTGCGKTTAFRSYAAPDRQQEDQFG